jgi:hypothetical protein
MAVAGECGLPAYVAVMVDVPGLTPVARPVPDPIVATGVPLTGTRSTALQVETAVLLKVDPSLNVSIAANCWVPVTGIEAVAGITLKDTDVAAFTVNTAVAGECGLPAYVAVMVDVPGLTPVARPVCNPIVATGVPLTGTRSTAVQLETAVLS